MANGKFEKVHDPDKVKEMFAEEAPPPVIAWPTPKPLERQSLLAVEALPLALLPEPLRIWVQDIANRMDDSTPDYAAIGVIVALASLIGRKVAIHPKRHDDWTVTPNLWGVAIGRASAKKSPALREALKPLRALEVEEFNTYKTSKEEFAIKEKTHKLRMRAAEECAKKTFSKPGGVSAEEILTAAENESPEEPKRRRYVLNDTTIEKLGEILADNPAGLLLFRDELIGWLNSLEREDRNQDRAFYLEAWNGNGSFVYDRIGRGTVDIQSACVSILGGITPAGLHRYVRAMEEGAGDDGLLQRFQLMVYPDPSAFNRVDRWPNTEAKNAAVAVFKRIAGIPISEGDSMPALRFDRAGQAVFDDYYDSLHKKAANEPNRHVESHLAKYASLMPSLALVLHVATHGDGGDVGEIEASHAAAWCEYLESHARRVYALGEDPLAGARGLAERLTNLTNPFTRSQLRNRNWSGLVSKDGITRALNTLVELGHLHAEKVETGTKPRTDYYVNPALLESDNDG